MRKSGSRFLILSFSLAAFFLLLSMKKGPSYSDFETPASCGQCHREIYAEWKKSMMAQAYTHHWDEIEYFKLAVPHAERDPSLREAVEGCNGCHTPMAYVVGDRSPAPPSRGTRANESVSCEVCHTISGFKGESPFNFNYVMNPGKLKFGPRKGVKSPYHETSYSEFIQSPEFCAICHNEKNPYGLWVKSTYTEWKEGPYSKEGVRCQDCHMWRAEGVVSITEKGVPDLRHHTFPGGHVMAKIRGAIELRIYTDEQEYEPGEQVHITLLLYNAKAGHKLPTGSVEDRQLWVEVHAYASGKKYTIPVKKKGFEGEEYTLTSNRPAYFDMGYMMGIEDFGGLPRDDLEEGHRIFRIAFLDPQGRMTIAQWNTKSFGVDYRIGPRETVVEHYIWQIPEDAEPGKVKIEAKVLYRLLVRSVARFLGVPEEEYKVREINSASTFIEIVD